MLHVLEGVKAERDKRKQPSAKDAQSDAGNKSTRSCLSLGVSRDVVLAARTNHADSVTPVLNILDHGHRSRRLHKHRLTSHHRCGLHVDRRRLWVHRGGLLLIHLERCAGETGA